MSPMKLLVPSALLKKANTGNQAALFKLSQLAYRQNRLGLAKEFLRLAKNTNEQH